MGNKVGAILLDTRSIQRYVFGCNELKTNVGASYLVDAIYTEAMQNVLKAQDFKKLVLDWKENTDLQMLQDKKVDCEVGYIGGGKMLILVRNYGQSFQLCKKIVTEWSTELLLKAPGLKTGVAIGRIDLDNFNDTFSELFQKLNNNESKLFPNVDMPYTGLTLECDSSGKTADFLDSNGRMISTEVAAKIKAHKYVIAKNSEQFNEVLQNNYEFAKDISNIGFKDGESYICVIHIDGNNMGVKFNSCNDLKERRELSLNIAGAVNSSLQKLVKKIVDEYEDYIDLLDVEKLLSDNKPNLPLRPIIIGGDDVTFVCPGRVGLQYASYFMKKMAKIEIINNRIFKELQGKLGKSANKTMTCCAGVAIVPAKYPFFRAYQLAEQLCSAAKLKSREVDGYYLDFAILHGEMYADLDTLRKEQYVVPCGGLHYGPYDVVNSKSANSFDKLLQLKEALMELPSNKLKDLRAVLHEDIHSQYIFMENCKEFDAVLAILGHNKRANKECLWENVGDKKITRLMDAIEIIDYTY